MAQNNVRFFLQGGGARLLWDPDKNRVHACAVNGVFAVTDKTVAAGLTKNGYVEVTAERLAELGFKQPPKPDVTDWNVRHDARYTFL